MKPFKAHQCAVYAYRGYTVHRVMPMKSHRLVFRVYLGGILVGKFFDGYGPNGYRTFIDKRLLNENNHATNPNSQLA